MTRLDHRGGTTVLALVFLAAACAGGGAAPRPIPKAQPPGPVLPAPPPALAEIDRIAVVALSAPAFAGLSREQRVYAYWMSRAGAAAGPIALDQAYRHDVEIVRLLRGILAHPEVVPAPVLVRLRAWARAVWLHGGIHDALTQRKLVPPFTASDLRIAALASQAAGADLGLGGEKLEMKLRVLEAAIFEPSVDALRAARPPGRDPLAASAVNFYQGITSREVLALPQRQPHISRLSREGGHAIESVVRVGALYDGELTRALEALRQARLVANPAQQAFVDELFIALRTGDPAAWRAVQLRAAAARGPVEARFGFLEPSYDPRGQKLAFAAVVGVAVPDARLSALAAASPSLEELLPWPPRALRPLPPPPSATGLQLVASAGAWRTLRPAALLAPGEASDRAVQGRRALVPGEPLDDEARGVLAPSLAALVAPAEASALAGCAGELQGAFVALRELAGTAPLRVPRSDPFEVFGGDAPELELARRELSAHALSADPRLLRAGVLTAHCAALWPSFAAGRWLLSLLATPQGAQVDGHAGRVALLQLRWFAEHGGLAWRREQGRGQLAVDAGSFAQSARALLELLNRLEAQEDARGVRELFEWLGTRLDPALRDEVRARLAGIPRALAALPPRLEPVLDSARGRVVDARAVVVTDVDAEVLGDWAELR